MYFPPLHEYAEFALGFLIGWVLMDLVRFVFSYVKLLWIRRSLKRDIKVLEEDIARYKITVDTSSKSVHNTNMQQKTYIDKVSKVDAILTAMAEAYEREGVEGDFADARRYYLNDATEAEIDYDYAKWCLQM